MPQTVKAPIVAHREIVPSPYLLDAWSTLNIGSNADVATIPTLLSGRGGMDLEIGTDGGVVTGMGANAGWATLTAANSQFLTNTNTNYYNWDNSNAGFMSLWTKSPSSAAAASRLVLDLSMAANNQLGLRLFQQTTEVPQVFLGNVSDLDAATNLTDGTHHIGVWWSPAAAKFTIFVDGVQKRTSGTVATAVPTVNCDIYVGCQYNGTDTYSKFYDGQVGRIIQIGKGAELTIDTSTETGDTSKEVNRLMRWVYAHPYSLVPEAIWG